MKPPRIRSVHIFAAATLGGMASALVIQVALARGGIAVTDAWRNLFVTSGDLLRSAIAWWSVAGASMLGGFVTASVMRRFVWLHLRFLRGWLLALLVVGLAVVARDLPRGDGIAHAAHLIASASALLLSFLMAGFGGYFALRR